MKLDMLYGVLQLDFWQYVLAAVVMVQFTFMAVTLYLHRDATHRSLDLHPLLRHVFRFWLWMSSGMLTSEWVAVHRKHHARCETPEDPHSPVIHGLKKVLLEGAELYKQAAATPGLVEKYGRGTPNDWMERNVYQRHTALGIVLMVLLDLVLFGVPGIIIIGVQMLAVPLMAAGVINGLGHHTGYRNFECSDAARNIVPWGVLVGGEELHNNHHAFPSSAKFSVQRWEFDIGWLYICVLRTLRLAKVRRLAPKLTQVPAGNEVSLDTLRAVLVNRMHILRNYARQVTAPTCRDELRHATGRRIRAAKRLLIRDALLLDGMARHHLHGLLGVNHRLRTVYEFRERLNALWNGTHTSNERLLHSLRSWIADAEASGLPMLQRYAFALRATGMPAS
jgi:stearoyl-CoA desaturase (Delta-9 desaturase)